MNFKALSYLIFAAFISACGKYKHEELSTPECCELCAHALTLEGIYRGEVYIHQLFAGIETTDSATMTVQQVFLNNSTYDDSTSMYFATTFARDSFPNSIVYDTINIHDEYGVIENWGQERHWMRNDTIFHQRFFPSGWYFELIYEGLFLRQ